MKSSSKKEVLENREPKKLALLRILQILQKHSDRDHPLMQKNIAGCLNDDYGIVLERKAVSYNLSLLREAGYEIEKNREGYYLDERDFTDSELRILIDGVLSSKYINEKHSEEMIDKLCALSNRYFLSRIKHVYTVGDWDKTENYEVFCNIDIVDEAIEKGKRIRFDYKKYHVDKKLHTSATHCVSPYQLILRNQRYYLMGYHHYHQNIIFYRIDRIENMEILEENLVPIREIKGYENGINYKEIATALPYMYSDKPEPVEFIAQTKIIDQIIDWFGKDIRISQYDDDADQIKVSVKVSPKAMVYWALQYAEYVRVISPQPLVDKIKEDLQTAAEKYGS